MPSIVWMVIAVLLTIAGVSLATTLRARQKRRRAIRAEFGSVPQTQRGLHNAQTFWQACAQHGQASGAVDDLTWNDLDMDEVFGRLNYSQSSLGDIYLYAALRRLQGNAAALQNREETIETLKADTPLREALQFTLGGLGRQSGLGLDFLVFHPQFLLLPGRRLFWALAFLPFVGLALLPFSLNVGLVWLLLSLLLNVVLTFVVRTKTEQGFRVVRYLAAALYAAAKLQKQLGGKLPAQAQTLTEACRPFARFRLGYTLLAINDFWTQAGMLDPGSFFLLPVLSYNTMAAALQTQTQAIQQLYNAIGEVELAIGVLSLRTSLPIWCTPAFAKDGALGFQQLYHPLLEDAVPNNGAFEGDVLVTGSNASGKSTFIKAVALNCILAQTVYTCTAAGFALRFGFVASSMAVQDSVVDGDSYFVAEIKSMLRLVQKTQNNGYCYFFIDEILKGTNTVERVAAAAAVLLYLHKANCLCLAATHDVELPRILSPYKNIHFAETITPEGDIRFTYKMLPGPAKNRNAIRLLGSMGFPGAITATRLAQGFEQSGEWQVLAEND